MGSVVDNSITRELKLGSADCTNSAHSRLAYPVAADVFAVKVSANRVEAPVILVHLVTFVLRFFALVAVAPVRLRFDTVFSSVSISFRFLSSSAPSVLA